MQKNWLKVFLLILVTAVAFFFLRSALLPFLGGLVLAYLLAPLTDFFAKKFPRSVSILLVYFLLASVLFFLGLLLLPRIYREIARLGEYLPSYMEWITEELRLLETIGQRLNLPWDISGMLDESIASFQTGISTTIKEALLFIPDMIGKLVPAAMIPVTAFYFLRDQSLLSRRFKSLLKPETRDSWNRLWRELDHILRKYIRGYLLLAFWVGGMFCLAMLIMRMDYAILLGLIMGLGEFIPYFGPFLAVLPAIFFAALDGFGRVVQVLAVFIVVQQIESLFLTPRVIGKSVGLHPLAVILALLVAGHWMGFWGLLWGVPIMATVFYSAVWLYRKRAGEFCEK